MERGMERMRRRWGTALLVSVAAAVVAVVWLTGPDTYPYGPEDRVQTGINYLIDRGPAAVMLLTAAAVGILLAAVALWAGATPTGLRVAGAGAAVEAAFFAVVMADGSVLPIMGYTLALVAPVAAAALLVLVGRTWRPVGYALAGLLLVVAVAGTATGVLSQAGAAVGTYLDNLSYGAGIYGARSAWSLAMAAAAACWGWVAFGSLVHMPAADWSAQGGRPSWATPESSRRWGRVATIVAALCMAPYGLVRLTWLTPWPLGGPGIDEFVITRSLDAVTRLQGFLFAPACAVGIVLTLGLISRWGEVFPRWVPVLAGRAVPVKLAVVPGTVVAAMLTIAAPGFLIIPIESGDLREVAYMFFAFPLPVWGPALGAAVLAYWLRRTGQLPGRRGPAGAALEGRTATVLR